MEYIFNLLLIFIPLYLIVYFFTKIKSSFFIKNNKDAFTNNDNDDYDQNFYPLYTNKSFMTYPELEFYNKIIELETEYNIVPQVCLASIINKSKNKNNRYQSELYRLIDFAIFTKDYKKLLLLIELNDTTHNNPHRRDRDLKVQKICNDANIEIMKFYSSYPNENDYVLKRILESILKKQDQ